MGAAFRLRPFRPDLFGLGFNVLRMMPGTRWLFTEKSLVIVMDLSVYGPLLCQSQTWKIENSSLPIMGLSSVFLSVAHSSLSTLLSLVAAVINEQPPFWLYGYPALSNAHI